MRLFHLEHHAWVLNLVAAGLCALLLGRAAASAVQLHLLASPVSAAPVRARGEAPATSAPVVSAAEAIVRRNIFCSDCPPAIEVAGAAGVARAWRRSDLPLQLLAVNQVVDARGGQHRTASVRDKQGGAVGAFAVGDQVKSATVIAIHPTALLLNNAGVTEVLDLLDTGPGAEAAALEPTATPTGDPLSRQLARAVKKVGDNSYQLSRATLEEVLGNMSLLARSARFIPELRDGKPAGFRLAAVRPGGPLALIGLQNGDLVVAINGLELTGPDGAFAAYSKLRSASYLSLGLERAGVRLTIDYAIR